MRKFLKNNILDLLQTLYEAHSEVNKFINTKDIESAKIVLVDLQKAALQIGTTIESSEGKGFVTLKYIAEYCSIVFEISQSMSENPTNKDFRKILDDALIKVENSVKTDIKIKLEIIFASYKAAMWDSLESIWAAAAADPDCNAYVIPIPYYDRNPDHSLGKFHYEGNEYPDYVPITDYRKYDYKTRRPDIVYIHNPYDDCNYVTSVHPDYFSSVIKKYTDCLVYVPYFVLQEISPNDIVSIKNMEHFCLAPGVVNADKVILQSENMRQIYINVFIERMGDTAENRKALEKKFSGEGSPKFDKILNMDSDDIEIPESWKKFIYKPDGTRKKVIFYNTGISGLLSYNELWLDKLEWVIGKFREIQEDAVLLWRPHPLIESTLSSMRVGLFNRYQGIKQNYINEGLGIYDDSSDLNRAIILSNGYYGDHSSVICLYQKTGKPVMIQGFNHNTFEENFRFSTNKIYFTDDENIVFPIIEFNAIYSYNLKENKSTMLWLDDEKKGEMPYSSIVEYKKKFLFAPLKADKVLLYDQENKESRYIDIEKKYIDGNFELWDAFTYKDNAYLIPGTYDAILKYNFSDDTVEYIDSWIDAIIKARGIKPHQYFQQGYALIDNMLYLAFFESNHILKLNLDTNEHEILEVYNRNLTFTSICTDGKYCYIAASDGNVIVFDPSSNNFSIINSLPEIGITGRVPYEVILYSNGKVYTIPYNSNRIMVISVKDFSCSSIEINEGNRVNSIFALSGCINNDNLYFYSFILGGLMEIDLINNNQKLHIIREVNDKNIKRIQNIKNNFDKNINAYIEYFNTSLSQFIELTYSEFNKKNFPEQCGKKIWEENKCN